MQQDLAVKRLGVVVGGDDAGGEAVALEGDAVDEVEAEGPVDGGEGVEPGRVGAQAEVELDGGLVGGRPGHRLGGRLAQELPPRGAGEAVLREGLGLGVGWGRAEDLWIWGREVVSKSELQSDLIPP